MTSAAVRDERRRARARLRACVETFGYICGALRGTTLVLEASFCDCGGLRGTTLVATGLVLKETDYHLIADGETGLGVSW